jgi:hypothetical protein
LGLGVGGAALVAYGIRNLGLGFLRLTLKIKNK